MKAAQMKSPKRCRALHYIARMQAIWWGPAQKQPVRPHHAVLKTDEVEDQNLQLNDLFKSFKVKPVGNKSWLELSCASDSTKRRYFDCAADAIVATLNVLSRENASHP